MIFISIEDRVNGLYPFEPCEVIDREKEVEKAKQWAIKHGLYFNQTKKPKTLKKCRTPGCQNEYNAWHNSPYCNECRKPKKKSIAHQKYWTPERCAQVLADKEAGMSMLQLAKKYEMTYEAMRKRVYLIKNGLQY